MEQPRRRIPRSPPPVPSFGLPTASRSLANSTASSRPTRRPTRAPARCDIRGECRVGWAKARSASLDPDAVHLAHAILDTGLTALSGYGVGNGEVAVAHPGPADMLMRD